MANNRTGCKMRHENGNCTVAGGFCTAVNDPICEALHNAYDCGYTEAIHRVQEKLGNKVEAKGVEIDPVNYATKTNADRIRSMSDEELSEFINTTMTVCDCCVYDGNCVEYANIMKCRKGVLGWLQKPVKGG